MTNQTSTDAGTASQRRPPDPDASAMSSTGEVLRKLLRNSYLILVLLVIILIGFIASPNFLTSRNATNVITFAAITSILAVGQFFVVLTGGIDLSVGSVLAMSTVISALLLQQGYPTGVVVVLALLATALVGLFNGVLVVWLGIPPFIATLATLSMVQGLSYIIQSTSLIQITNETFVDLFSEGTVLGIRNPILIFVVVMLAAAFVARYTTFGRRLYALGGNREAARLSGLPVGRDLLTTYTLSGAAAGLAGLVAAAQLLQGSSLIGQGYELSAIAAVVVGGASLAGGRGDPISAVIGGFIIGLIINIMNLVGISSEPQLVIKGAVIIVAVFLSSAGGIERLSMGVGKRTGRRRRRNPERRTALAPSA